MYTFMYLLLNSYLSYRGSLYFQISSNLLFDEQCVRINMLCKTYFGLTVTFLMKYCDILFTNKINYYKIDDVKVKINKIKYTCKESPNYKTQGSNR
jgi:hypothetical protein